jgi:hypothetical protein
VSDTFKADLRIPDLWFDFYARLLPGCAFVATIYILAGCGRTGWPSATAAVILAAAGYFSASVTQPITSLATRALHAWAAPGKINKEKKWGFNERATYVLELKQGLSRHEGEILSKMHGETTFFAQCGVLSGVLAVLMRFGPPSLSAYSWLLAAGAAVLFFLLGYLTARRRRTRAEERRALPPRS